MLNKTILLVLSINKVPNQLIFLAKLKAIALHKTTLLAPLICKIPYQLQLVVQLDTLVLLQ